MPNTSIENAGLREENRGLRRENMQLQKEVERLRAALRIRERSSDSIPFDNVIRHNPGVVELKNHLKKHR